MPTDDETSEDVDPTTDELAAFTGVPDAESEPYVEVPPARRSGRRSTIVVVVLLLVISGAIGVLLGLGSGQGPTSQRPVTTLAPEPPTTAPTSTATVPASTTPP